MRVQRSPIEPGGAFPAGSFRIDYPSEVDGYADWAIVNPGQRADLWFVVLHGHGSHGDQLYTRPDIRDAWLPDFQRYGGETCGVSP